MVRVRRETASVVFVEKTLFCNHLNIVLASETARREIASAAGDCGHAMLARLAEDFDSKRDRWPVLGFYGDECLFDAVLDQYLTKNETGSFNEVGAAYRRIFFEVVRFSMSARSYIRCIMEPGSRSLEPTIPVSNNDILHLSEIMKQHGPLAHAIELRNQPVRGWILSDLGSVSTDLFMGLSATFVAAVVFWIVIAARRRLPEFSARAGIVIVLWAVSILSSAAAHTLDEWRYLVPSTPMVGLLLSLVSVELVETIVAHRQRV